MNNVNDFSELFISRFSSEQIKRRNGERERERETCLLFVALLTLVFEEKQTEKFHRNQRAIGQVNGDQRDEKRKMPRRFVEDERFNSDR